MAGYAGCTQMGLQLRPLAALLSGSLWLRLGVYGFGHSVDGKAVARTPEAAKQCVLPDPSALWKHSTANKQEHGMILELAATESFFDASGCGLRASRAWETGKGANLPFLGFSLILKPTDSVA